jgi:DNA-binding response OmpR family regulator
MSACRTCGQSLAPSYLGLVFDWKARTVSREDAQPVRLPASLLMILDALCSGHGKAVSEAALLAAYRMGTATCARLISRKVSFLRGVIAPLGLGITTVRGKGYRLVDIAEDTA